MTRTQPRDDHGRWTHDDGGVPLRDHVDALLAAAAELDDEKWRGHDEAHELIALALKNQLVANEDRLRSMNEWRGTVSDLTGRFVDRATFETLKTARGDEIESLKLDGKNYLTVERYERDSKEADARNRARTQWMITLAVSLTMLAIAFSSLVDRLWPAVQAIR
jgi:hypothetical protein